MQRSHDKEKKQAVSSQFELSRLQNTLEVFIRIV